MPTPAISGDVSAFSLSGINDLDAVLNGDRTKWGAVSTNAATVTYSFPAAGAAWMTDYGNEVTPANFLALSAAQQLAAENALATWSTVANITFQKVTETASSVGDIRIGFSYAVGDEAWGYAYYPNSQGYAGDIWINRKTVASATFTPGDYDYEALIHEIGHAIGLKHPGNYNAGGGGTEGPYITKALDKTNFTVMSYSEPEWNGLSPKTPGVYDILALQYLYGANTTTNTGSTTYTYLPSSLVGESIWDAGGTDTVDASAFGAAVRIDLRAGKYSDIGLQDNVGIAYGATIENAKGGAAGDTLYGNEISNTLTGGGGGDKFVFISPLNASSNVDAISDFVSGTDKLYLGRTVFASLTPGVAPDSALATFKSGTGGSAANAATSTSHLLFDSDTGSLYYDSDANGSAPALKFAVLNGVTSLKASDIQAIEVSPEDSRDEQVYDGSSEAGTDGKDDLDGGDDNDYIDSDDGNDTVDGAEGDDYINGGPGNDSLDGGDGIDYLDGDAGNDRIDGAEGDDEIYCGEGNDTLIGGAGDDYAEGEGGNDSLAGGDGDDLLGGGDGTDKLDGGAGNDELYGDDGNDQMTGGAGDDWLNGGAGNDKMTGGAGDDVYYVDAKSDSVTEKAGEGTDAVVSEISYTLGKDVEQLFLYTDSEEGLTGKGNSGDNLIVGTDNDDTLYGKEGNDELDGGMGADMYVFDTKLNAGTNVDSIADFISGEDMLLLSKKIFAAYKVTGEIDEDDFEDFNSGTETVAAATGSATRFLYDTATGDLYYDKDGSGSAAAIKFVTLVGSPELEASDLMIIA